MFEYLCRLAKSSLLNVFEYLRRLAKSPLLNMFDCLCRLAKALAEAPPHPKHCT